MTDTKPRVSGWCSAPAGVRPKHEGCRAEVCFCLCHEAKEVD